MTQPQFTADWFSHNIPHLQRILARYAGQPDVRALEIGSYEGRSTLWMLENVLTHPTARIDCIDTFEGSDEHRTMRLDLNDLLNRFRNNIKLYNEKVSWFRGQSQEVLRDNEFYEGWWTWGPYDFVYIDGSHRAADVLEDAVLSFRLLKLGGLMIFDDYAWTGGGPSEFDNPRRGIDAFHHAYQDQLKTIHLAYQAIFERVEAGRIERMNAREMVRQLVGEEWKI